MATHDIPTLQAQPRNELGKRHTARLRKLDRLPAVVYGHKKDPVHVSIDRGQLRDLLHHETHLLQLDVAGSPEHCLVKDVQWDHLGDTIIHADFARVDLTEEVEVEVDLRLIGDAVGLKESGAYLDTHATTVSVKTQAGHIPDHLTADISELKVGESLTVADLELPKGVAATADPETILASINIAKAEVEPEEGAEATTAEPAVIKKEKAEPEDDKK